MKNRKNYLSQEAIADGNKSGLTKDDMLKLGMHSIDASEMNERFGISAEGLVIPYGKDFCRAKIMKQKSKFGESTNRKYTQPSNSTSQLYLPKIGQVNWDQVAINPTEIILVTEGEKKAAAACKAGYNCIGLGGVWNFKSKHGALADWNRFIFTGRTVFIVYDSDIVDKPQVRYAEYALAVELASRGANVMRVRLPHTGDKVGLDDFLVDNELMNSVATARAAFDKLPREKIDPSYSPHLTEMGNAIRLAQEFGECLRYVPKWKAWVVFDKQTGLWSVDEDGATMRCAKHLSHILREEAKKIDNDTVKKAVVSWATRSESEHCLKATINLAKSEPELTLSDSLIGADTWKLAFRNGTTINLQTGSLEAVLPEDYLMKSTSVAYDPNAKCPRWQKFLLDVMQGDKELVKFLQRAVGYSLTGSMTAQCFFITYGGGANGKSTFLNTLLALFGEYARQAAPQTFMASKGDASTPRSDLCRLVGVRLVATSETESYQRLGEALIKQWTGGEQIVTRDMYGKTFEFSPQGKLWLATNHRPQIRGTDDAIWRRVVLIPFTRTFAEHERDPELADKLKAELSGILNWALRGCKDWQEHGLKPPETVTSAVKKYRADMDIIGEWMKERCDTGEECQQLVSVLFSDYREWAKSTEEYIMRQRDFTHYLEERGYRKKQTTVRAADSKGWFLLGLDLKSHASARPKFMTPQPRSKR